MERKKCQIVLVGHLPEKLILSIDKETFNKIIFITEKETLSGTIEAKKALDFLIKYYKKRMVKVESTNFSFQEQTKSIAELVYIIIQQKLLGFRDITVNVSGGLRFMDIWFYLGCSITNTKIIHGDFIYKGREEVGINNNVELVKIPLDKLTLHQFKFLELFFENYGDINDFVKLGSEFDNTPILTDTKEFNSINDLKKAFEGKIRKKISRGAVNGYINKLKENSILLIAPNQENKQKTKIGISYLGIAYFLNELYNRHKSKFK